VVTKHRKWVYTLNEIIMNSDFNNLNQNKYDGNGWSKYQLMVLQQLEDHSKLLHNLNKELTDMRQNNAVSEMELKMWKTGLMSSVSDIEESIDFIQNDEKGLINRVNKIEREIDVEEHANIRLKATWALYGSIAMFLSNIIIQLVRVYLKI